MDSRIKNSTGKRSKWPFRLLLLGALAALQAFLGFGQMRRQSAAELIRFLTYQSGRQRRLPTQALTLAGGEYRENFDAAKQLADLGSRALPDLERALSSIEAQGQRSPSATNAGWLLLAYARIKGPAAYSRLRPMMDSTGLDFIRACLDRSLAVSLHLTSYVSGFVRGGASDLAFQTVHGPEPRDGLDALIRAWETDDQAQFRTTLGPNTRTAFEKLIQGQAWAERRTQLWPGRFQGIVALGYRFGTTEAWGRPEEPLESPPDPYVDRFRYPSEVDTSTFFTNRAGADCGEHRVQMVRARNEGPGHGRPRYLIETTDLNGLLRLIATCATEER